MISYCSNREDVLLSRALKQVKKGFYVDVGAHHPIMGSLTKHFYDSGWSGINIEPGAFFDAFNSSRPRDVNLNVAASDHSGTIEFYETDNDLSISTTDSTRALATTDLAGEFRKREVRALTLTEILDSHAKDKTIDFLSIDTEGSERDVLLGNDWQRYRPRILVIESTLPWTNTPCHESWEPIILNANYSYAYFDGINRFYVRKEDADLLSAFTVPVNVIDDYTPFELAHFSKRISAAKDSIVGLREVVSELTTLVNGQDTLKNMTPKELVQTFGLRKLVKGLLSGIVTRFYPQNITSPPIELDLRKILNERTLSLKQRISQLESDLDS